MQAEILSIGDELLIGQVVNTNAATIGQALTGVGIPVVHGSVIRDDLDDIVTGLKRAWQRSDIIVLTGGLGPTRDDKTVAAVAAFFDSPLVFSESTWSRLNTMFAQFGRTPTEAHRQQCMLPADADLLTNRLGTAPGMHFSKDGRHLFVMPGVPYEMEGILAEYVIPRIRNGLNGVVPVQVATICTVGEGESRLAEQIKDIEDGLPPGMQLAYLPRPGQVRVRITSRHTDHQEGIRQLHEVSDRIAARLAAFVYAREDIPLADALGRQLADRRLMLGVAESCTGGYLGHLITSIPGSSAWFAGGGITYSNTLKMRLLGVAEETLAQSGAVSEATAVEMARGAVQHFSADLAVAVTGIAGPDGGTPDKPVGTVWICVADANQTLTRLFHFGKDRARNIELSAVSALNLVRKFLTRP